MPKLLLDGSDIIVDVTQEEFPVAPPLHWVDGDGNVGDTWNGTSADPPPAQTEPPEYSIQRAYRAVVEASPLAGALMVADNPDQITNWVDNNVNNLADARTALKAIALTVALLSRVAKVKL